MKIHQERQTIGNQFNPSCFFYKKLVFSFCSENNELPVDPTEIRLSTVALSSFEKADLTKIKKKKICITFKFTSN